MKVAHVQVLTTRTRVSRVKRIKLPHEEIRKLSQGFLMIRESDLCSRVAAQCFCIVVTTFPDSEERLN